MLSGFGAAMLGEPKETRNSMIPSVWEDCACNSGKQAIFSRFWGDFFTKLQRKAGEHLKNPVEKVSRN